MIVAVCYIALFSILSVNVQTYIQLDLLAYQQANECLTSVNYNRDESTLYLDEGTCGYALPWGIHHI